VRAAAVGGAAAGGGDRDLEDLLGQVYGEE
jgi:hypothetical protein